MRVLLVVAILIYYTTAVTITVDAKNGPYKTFTQGTYNFTSTFTYQLGSLQILADPSGVPVLTGKQVFGITGSNLFVVSGFLIQNTVTSSAPFQVKDVGNVVLSNNIFTGNSAPGNGSCFTGNPSNLTVTNCSFVSNTGTFAPISVFGTNTVTVTNSAFRSNKATNKGAGIYVSTMLNVTHVVVSNCTFDNNNSKEGTSIYVESAASQGSTLKVYSSTFTNNIAVNVGAGVSVNNINTTFDNCIFQNNTASTSGSCYGGAIYLVHDYFYTTTISNCKFIRNFASYGSAIFITTWTGVFTIPRSVIYNSTFDNQQHGTDLYAFANNITVEKCLFTNSLYQSIYLSNTPNNIIKSTTIRGNNVGISCNDAGFNITSSSIYNNTNDLQCSTCSISGQWSSFECSQGSCQRDVCSVCGGNGTQCLGCDGQIWSEKTIDICGICGGNGTSCLSGCDNLPYSNTTDDICGVCGGNGTTCATGFSPLMIQTNTKSSSNIGVIVGAVVGGVVGLCLVIFVVLFLVRRNRKPKDNVNNRSEELTDYSTLHSAVVTPNHYSTYEGTDSNRASSPVLGRKDVVSTEDKYALDYSEIKFEKQIGEGSFGTVWKCTWRLSPVAVKQIKKGAILTEVQMDSFIAEAILMRNMRSHRNVVAMLGMCMDPLCIVTEFCEQGSLISLLLSKKPLEMTLRIQILKDVAAGMAHLEKENIIHRDLAARNVLLGKGYEAKVSDFGLSRLSEGESGVSTISAFGPLKWWAFETLTTKTFTHKSDVWSFGVLCIEVLTRQAPYPDMTTEDFALQVIPKKLSPINQIPQNTPQALAKLVASCFDFNPEKRPSFNEIFTSL